MSYFDYMDKMASVSQDEQFDSVTGTPWESISSTIPHNATVQETLDAAELDWSVEKRPLLVESADGELITVPKTFCLMRTDTDEFLSPYMGKSYKPVQNDRAFEVFEQFVRAGDMSMETAGSLLGGKHIWGLAHINSEFTLGDGEKIRGYFLLMQSHAYGHALKAMFTAIRFPGGHSMVRPLTGVGGSTGVYSMPHSRVFDNDRVEEIKDLLTRANASMYDLQKKSEFLANTNMTEEDGIFYLANVFDQKLIENCKGSKNGLPKSGAELLESDEVSRTMKNVWNMSNEYEGSELSSCKGTAWGYYNTILYAIDHQLGHRVDTRLKSAWIGDGSNLKIQALDVALALSAAK